MVQIVEYELDNDPFIWKTICFEWGLIYKVLVPKGASTCFSQLTTGQPFDNISNVIDLEPR